MFNTFRLAYQLIDPTGLPDPLCGYSFKLKGLMVEKLTQALNFPVEEDIARAAGSFCAARAICASGRCWLVRAVVCRAGAASAVLPAHTGVCARRMRCALGSSCWR